jgi:hypothetical protein
MIKKDIASGKYPLVRPQHTIANTLLAILNKVKEVNWEIGVRTNFGFKID